MVKWRWCDGSMVESLEKVWVLVRTAGKEGSFMSVTAGTVVLAGIRDNSCWGQSLTFIDNILVGGGRYHGLWIEN